MLDLILPLVICAVFVRVHTVWVFVYCVMIALKTFTVTAIVTDVGLYVLYVVTFLFIVLVYASFKMSEFRPFPPLITWVGICMALVRLPVNYMFVRDIIFRLRQWQVLPAGGAAMDLPLGGVMTPVLVELLLLATILLSVVLLLLYFRLSRMREDPR
jgi:hypothetical protein